MTSPENALQTNGTPRRVVRYAIVGLLGTLLDVGLFAALHVLFGIPVLLANTTSYSAGIVNNFILHRRWTYAGTSRKAVGVQFVQFAAVSLSAMAVNNLLVLWLSPQFQTLLATAAYGDLMAKACATGVGLCWNYLANNSWTFRILDFSKGGDERSAIMAVKPYQDQSLLAPTKVAFAVGTVPQGFSLSIVVPVHNEASVLPELYKRVQAVMHRISARWELVLVDDGSRDESAEVIALLCSQDERVRGISLTRNFGFQAAISAGLDAARGDAVILMDADLQDPPEVIPEMVAQWQAGFDVVYGVRSERRGETLFKRATASVFYRLIRRLTSVDIPADTGDFRLMDRHVVNAIREMPEQHRFLRGMVSWVGFKQTGVAYKRQPRYAGETKFTLGKMVRFAVDAITGFSYLPLQLASYVGVAVALLCVLAIISIVGLGLFGVAALPGQAITLVAVLFLGSVQLICLGIVGEYIARMHDEVRRRPLYLVERRWGFEKPRRHSNRLSEIVPLSDYTRVGIAGRCSRSRNGRHNSAKTGGVRL